MLSSFTIKLQDRICLSRILWFRVDTLPARVSPGRYVNSVCTLGRSIERSCGTGCASNSTPTIWSSEQEDLCRTEAKATKTHAGFGMAMHSFLTKTKSPDVNK
ncbi:hypothetical protein Poli38472_004671 [Pythium oligandrum]|uniref:Uncharacterized protein n=1 Tax=Pythium oligandrum TaxID=41045 RepID=A0A8K1CAI8_PYTOL|nr:hypothetical protein Poli38472_004671 [Pythium oligandrum]|eukprot:TMW59602.1 hypothetical protein Poli38472_004671 [Pythium oligandrum]